MRILFFLIISLTFINCNSQNTNDLYEFRENGKFGLIDREGNVVVKPIYNKIGHFKDGLAAVTIMSRAKNDYHKILNTRLGYIDKKGELVIPLKFQHIDGEKKDFSEGLAVVKIKDKYGYVNKSGDIVIQPIYSEAYPFNEDCAVVKNRGNFFLINENEEIIFDLLLKFKEQVDNSVESVVVNRNYTRLFKNKIAVRSYVNGKSVLAVFNKKGDLVFRGNFKSIYPLSEGNAIVSVDCDSNKPYVNCYTLINEQGEFLKKRKFASIAQYMKGLYIVQDSKSFKYGIIDEQGDLLFPLINLSLISPQAFHVFPDSPTLIPASDKNGKSGFIDEKGNVIIDFQYDGRSAFSEGLAFLKKNDRTVHCIDEKGNVIFEIKPEYNANWGSANAYDPFPTGIFQNGLATIHMKIQGHNKLVHINRKGELLTIKKN